MPSAPNAPEIPQAIQGIRRIGQAYARPALRMTQPVPGALMLFGGLVGSIGSDTALSVELDDDVSERVKLPDPPGRQLRIHHATQ